MNHYSITNNINIIDKEIINYLEYIIRVYD